MNKALLKEIFSWIMTFVIAIILALLIRTFIFEVVQVKQSSMYPTLVEDERLICVKIGYKFSSPKRGDIVVIKIDENTDYVKRIIACGGEKIKIENSKVYINGKELVEEYLEENLIYDDFSEVTVPEGCYFVMGDNRPGSKDSRDNSVGFIAKENIVGKVVFRLFPFDRFGKVN